MSIRLSAALFAALFLIGAFPVLFAQHGGSASAGTTAGFIVSTQDGYHAMVLVIIGLASTWIGGEALLVLPLCVLLMTVIGSLTEIDEHMYHAVHGFIIGAIILFAMSMSMLRNKLLLFSIPPVALWSYFAGSGFMQGVPPIATPLFFMMGIITSNALVLAIGVALGITLADRARESMDKFKGTAVSAKFLSFF